MIPAEKQKVYDEQRAKEIEKLKEAKIRIEKQVEMEKNKDMADEIRTAAHGEARKRNKSQDNVAHEKDTEEEPKPMSAHSRSSNNSFKNEKQDNLADPEIDKAFFYSVPKKEELKS